MVVRKLASGRPWLGTQWVRAALETPTPQSAVALPKLHLAPLAPSLGDDDSLAVISSDKFVRSPIQTPVTIKEKQAIILHWLHPPKSKR
jgi:hypothetical protein